MAVGVDRRLKKSAASFDDAFLLRPRSNVMPYDPLHRPSDAILQIPNPIASQMPEDRPESCSSQADQSVQMSPQHPIARKRRTSGERAFTIRRSSSTPHMRNAALGTTRELSPTADKRRNKLGYHRTSVACGHCRRRKIRCLVANDETTGRCANCIRLKKECNFYPVDQTPEPHRTQAKASKEAGVGARIASTTSSPRQSFSVLGSKLEEFHPPFPGNVAVNSIHRYDINDDSDSELGRITPAIGLPVQRPVYGYPQPIDTQWPPNTGFLPSSSVTESPSSSVGYWRPSPTTASSAFSTESNVSGAQTPVTINSAISYASNQDNQNWGPQKFQLPSRSMSYGNIEGLPNPPRNPLGVQSHGYRRTGPYPYPTSIDTNSAIIHSTAVGPHSSAPLSAPIVPGTPYNYPPHWHPYTGRQTPRYDGVVNQRLGGGQWFAEPGHLGQLQEEGIPPTTYAQHDEPHFQPGP